MLDRQATFNTMLTHLRQQGRPAYDKPSGSCRYRGPFGTKCAVGVLIPDGLYNGDFEGCNAAALVDCGVIPDAEGDDAYFLLDAQRTLHDAYVADPTSTPFPEWLEERAQIFAHRHHLTIPEMPS